MSRPAFVVAVLLLLAAAAAAFWPRRAAVLTPAAAPASTGPTAITVPARTLEGTVDAPPAEGEHLAVMIGGTQVADAAVSNGRYRLELPGKLASVTLEPLEGVNLPHGGGHLQGDARGANARIVFYQDANGNARYDPGEGQLEGGLFRAGADPGLRGFFRYGLVLLSGPASLKGGLDSPSGAKNFYRYDLDLKAGWSVLEGELASNGYDVREAAGSRFDAIVPTPPGSKGAPPAFTP